VRVFVSRFLPQLYEYALTLVLPFDLRPCIQIGIFPWALSTTLCVLLLFLCLLHVGPVPSVKIVIIGIFPWALSTTLCVFLIFHCLLNVGPVPSVMTVIILSMWKRTNYGASCSRNRWLVASCHTSLPPYCGTIRDSVPKRAAGSCMLAVAIFVDWYSQVDTLFSCRCTPFFLQESGLCSVSIFSVSLRTSQVTLRSLNIHVNHRRSRMTLISDRYRDNLKTTIALQNHRCEHL
jgi:hypothetical protein